MHKFIKFIKEFNIPKKKEFLSAIESLSKKEFMLFSILIAISIVSVLLMLFKINNYFMVNVPQKGGEINEGIVGTTTVINPVLAQSDADKDLVALVFSGLMRKDEDGNFIEDLAESYSVSNDGKVYTFILKSNLEFHDSTPVTADDVIFTIEKIKDPLVKSPKKSSWDNVTVTKRDDLTISFELKNQDISFMDKTTIGILPSNLWKNVNIQEFNISNLNTKPVGTGPYKLIKTYKNKDGVPQKYRLKYFKNFSLGEPNIKYINILSFSNGEDLLKALSNKEIDQAGGISPESLEKIKLSNYKINTSTLSRTFGLFFNNNQNKIFEDPSIIKAINNALNKDFIVNEVLKGYGNAIDNPIPQNISNKKDDYSFSLSEIEEAKELLKKSGWKEGEDGIMQKGGKTTITKTKTVKGKKVTETSTIDNGQITKLSFSITTGDTAELKQAVSIIKNQLIKIGIDVNTDKVYETGQLTQIIRNREYDALFFGQTIKQESDLYSFWHSSQRIDPGLNIAMSNNKNIDNILETAQKTTETKDRIHLYQKLIEEFIKNPQSVMIYSPQYIYVTPKTLNNIKINNLNNSSDRFNTIYKWYAKEDQVWKIFTK